MVRIQSHHEDSIKHLNSNDISIVQWLSAFTTGCVELKVGNDFQTYVFTLEELQVLLISL